MTFHLKKILGQLISPPLICLFLIILGLGLLWFTKRQRLGKIVTTVGAGLLLLLGYEPVANLFARPLEADYAVPLSPTPEQQRSVRWVVVLGGGHSSNPRWPANSQLHDSALVRLVEGIRLHRLLPESRLLVSGGLVYDEVRHAEVLARAAESLGVPREKIVMEGESRDTADEAVIIRRMIGDDPFVLVTSAWHMPRSMGLFRKQGMKPIPGPTDYAVRPDNGVDPWDFLPGPSRHGKVDYSFREHVGRLVSWMRGQI